MHRDQAPSGRPCVGRGERQQARHSRPAADRTPTNCSAHPLLLRQVVHILPNVIQRAVPGREPAWVGGAALVCTAALLNSCAAGCSCWSS